MEITPRQADVLVHQAIVAIENEREVPEDELARMRRVAYSLIQLLRDFVPDAITAQRLRDEPEHVRRASEEYLFRALREHPGNDHVPDEVLRAGLTDDDVDQVADRVEYLALKTLETIPLVQLSEGLADWDPNAELRAMTD